MSTSNKNRGNALGTHRRDFLKLALVTGGALATGRIVSDAGAAASERGPKPTAPQQQGYHVTSHIKNYYDKARF